MKAAPFSYERPRELITALTLVRDPEAKALAGGQSLVPAMAMRLARPQLLVDLNAIDELAGMRCHDTWLRCGALVRQRELELRPGLAQEVPLLAEMLPHVGHRETRNRGTVAGSLAHADPAGELPLAAVLLDARVSVRSLVGARQISGRELFRGPFETALGGGELICAVDWPLAAPGEGFAFSEIARRHGDYALCAVGVRVRWRDGALREGWIGLLGAGPTPALFDVSAELADADADDRRALHEVSEQVARRVSEAIQPPSDLHASSGYRRRLVRALVARELQRAVQRAGGREQSGRKQDGGQQGGQE